MVNLLRYLVDQLLRGCQFADNQFQALQNQEIEDFSVHRSQLPELEAEVVQIHLFIQISLRYLISVDQQDLVFGGFLFLWATCSLFSIFLLFRILECFCVWILYTLFTLVLFRHQGGVFYYCGLFKLCLPFVPLRQKRGSIYLFWTGNVFLTRSSDFCPRMNKWGVC